MRNQLSQLLALGPELTALILTAPLLLAQPASALPYTTVPSPNLDLGSLGRVALAGDYDSISIYQYVGQNEHAVNSNGSQGLLTRYPNGDFQSLDMTDAYIETMCPFVKDGQLQGVVVGGNFTSLGGVQVQGIALWNPDTQDVTALPGLSGQVKALYCDDDSGTVYVGGSFVGGNSSNAMAWTTGWTNLPFAGFNGPVSSIAKNDGKIVFGGSFSGLGNTTTPTEPDIQVVNLSSGKITGEGSTSRSEFSDPSKIVCNANTSEDSNTWLLQDGIPGFWQGDYGFGFNPTKLRLYNTEQEGRGTKTFYFENMNSGGILEMQYYDADGNNQTCSARCPLAHNATGQDFHFDPPVGMNSFRIRIVDWYGSGGGLSGIELYQDQIFAFAVSDFNEPSCKAGQQVSESSHTPDNNDFWIQKPNNGQTSSDYLSAFLTDSDQFNDDISVTFKPNIRQSGNYSVTVYTPGCIQDNTCITRGHVNLTASMTSDGEPISTTFFQTNNYDKFDQIYYGYIDAEADGFRPSVTLTPVSNQSIPLTVVAQRVRFELVNSTSGLNGLFEYDPNQAEVNTDFASNPINAAGSKLHDRAVVHAVATVGGDTFVAGNFNGSGISNVMKVGDNATALPNGGLNDEVQCMFQNGSTLYMGGNFSNTAEKSVEGLNSIAVFSAADNTWTALGAGVDGPVFSIVPVTLNVTSGVNETCLAVSGAFASVNAFGDNKSYNTSGIAVWVLSAGNWLHNIQDAAISVDGLLTSYTYVDGFGPLFGGSFSSQPVGLSGACELEDSGNALQSMGIKIQPPSSTTSNLNKRALNIDSSSNATGVYNGLFYGDNGLNITILGGSFAAEGSDGSTAENLVFINNTASEQTIRGVNGLDSSSIFVAMDTIDELLFAGGAVTGANGDAEVNGLVVIDLQTGDFASSQPPALSGDVVVVNAVATQPDSSIIYVGGDFDRAGGLSCRTMCYYDTEAQQWNTPGSGLSGTINSMIWISNDDLVIAGNLTIQGNSTTMATYNAKNAEYSTFEGASGLPGPIMALGAGDREYETWWAAGNNPESNVGYLSKFERHSWSAVSDLGEGTTVRGLQVLYVTDNHDDNELVPKDQLLMLSGNINTASAGNASVALFNGTTIAPFILASKSDGTPATMSQMFVSKPANLLRGADNHHLALGLVVLIGLAIALALIFMLVVAGILLERFRRRREGYVPMSKDRGNGNLSRIPPNELLGGLEEKRGSPPRL